jgi:hypothetical protein
MAIDVLRGAGQAAVQDMPEAVGAGSPARDVVNFTMVR